nr:MAG TPA: hypothetical protein [Caudoviricetes sp.]
MYICVWYIMLIIKNIFSNSPTTLFFRISFIWCIPLITPYYKFYFFNGVFLIFSFVIKIFKRGYC